MAIPFLSDVEHYGNKSSNVILDAAKFSEGAPATPQAGHFYTNNGVLYYRNASNIETPVHENSLREISAVGPLSAVTNGMAAQITIAQATPTSAGVIDAASFALLSGATDANSPSMLVKRDGAGAIAVGAVTATSLAVPSITGLPTTPTGDSEAVSKAYVDTQLVQALTASMRSQTFKPSVRVVVNTNTPLTSKAGTYDGVTLAAGDSLLLVGQTNAAENGVYTITGTGLARRNDSNSAADLVPGSTYEVAEGTFGQNFFTLAAPQGYALGTDPLTFVNVTGVNNTIAGDGLTKVGQTLNVVGTPGRVAIDANKVDIDPTYVGQSSITTVGAINQGTWNGTPIDLAHGGTGETTFAGIKDNLGISYELVFILGDGQAMQFPITHNLANSFPTVTGFYTMGGTPTPVGAVDYTIVNNNSITVRASLGSNPIPPNSLTVIIRAESNGPDYTNAPRPTPAPAAPAGYGG